jgi:hypothetical protein
MSLEHTKCCFNVCGHSLICHHISVTDISVSINSRQFRPCAIIIPGIIPANPKIKPGKRRIRRYAVKIKRCLPEHPSGKHHTPSIGLILRSALFGNVQGTAHITYNTRQHYTSYSGVDNSTHLSLTISPKIDAAADKVIKSRIRGLIQQHSAQRSQR